MKALIHNEKASFLGDAAIGLLILIAFIAIVAWSIRSANDGFRADAAKEGFTVVNVDRLDLGTVYPTNKTELYRVARELNTTTIYYDRYDWGMWFLVVNGTTAWNYRP